MEPRYLDIRGAATYLSRSPRALYTLVHERRIPFIKQGGRVMFDRVALDRWMNASAIDGTLTTRNGHVIREE
jgi:excisionase family DNA binding protein